MRVLAEAHGVPVLAWGSEGVGQLMKWTTTGSGLWLLSVYFGHLLAAEVLEAVQGRAVNLHAALLPWCRGVHTNIWPILDRCPAGVTLHVMVPQADAGAILLQRAVPVHPWDTGATLYARLSEAAYDLLASSWPEEALARWPGTPQSDGGSVHRLADFRALEEYMLPDTGDTRAFFDLLRARSFPGYPGLRIRIGEAAVEAVVELREVRRG